MYEVPAAKKSVKQNEFTFTIAGETFSVTSAKFLTGFQLEDITSGNLTAIYDIFGVRGTKSGDAVRSLDQERMAALIEAWMTDAGVTPGESKAS